MANCRVCGAELVEGENWSPSLAKTWNYICKQCEVARVRRWEKANPDKKRGRARKWARANPEKSSKWARANPDRAREVKHRHRARKQGATSIEVIDETAIYERDGYMCIYCGATENLTLDHIVPPSKGGAHREDNVVVACGHCNSSKQDRPLEEWLQTQPKALVWVM